jgi:hypothetical protein
VSRFLAKFGPRFFHTGMPGDFNDANSKDSSKVSSASETTNGKPNPEQDKAVTALQEEFTKHKKKYDTVVKEIMDAARQWQNAAQGRASMQSTGGGGANGSGNGNAGGVNGQGAPRSSTSSDGLSAGFRGALSATTGAISSGAGSLQAGAGALTTGLVNTTAGLSDRLVNTIGISGTPSGGEKQKSHISPADVSLEGLDSKVDRSLEVGNVGKESSAGEGRSSAVASTVNTVSDAANKVGNHVTDAANTAVDAVSSTADSFMNSLSSVTAGVTAKNPFSGASFGGDLFGSPKKQLAEAPADTSAAPGPQGDSKSSAAGVGFAASVTDSKEAASSKESSKETSAADKLRKSPKRSSKTDGSSPKKEKKRSSKSPEKAANGDKKKDKEGKHELDKKEKSASPKKERRNSVSKSLFAKKDGSAASSASVTAASSAKRDVVASSKETSGSTVDTSGQSEAEGIPNLISVPQADVGMADDVDCE